MLAIIFGVYVLNYFLGKRLNKKYAFLWLKQNKRLFDAEFSHVGASNDQAGDLLDVESANAFKFYATGRHNCSYILVTIEVYIAKYFFDIRNSIKRDKTFLACSFST